MAARRAFLGVKLPGRVEVLGRDPWRLVDSAHTRESAASLARFVEGLGASRRRFVLSVSLDKDLGSILDALLGLAQEVVVTRAEPVRALDPAEVAARIAERRPDVHVRVVEDPAAAVRLAVADLPPDALLCVAGSVYLAGVARQVLLEEGSGS